MCGGMLEAAAIPLSDVAVRPVRRLSTGIASLDWTFGSTTEGGRTAWGLPAGALTLLSASGGAGKSRLAIAVAASMTRSAHRILYCQSEVSLGQFKGWVAGKRAVESEFLVCSCDAPEALTDMIIDRRPSLVVIDSISMLGGMERQATAKRVVVALREAVEAVGAHGLLLAHENARRQVKGGTLLPHLVDVVARMERTGFADWVRFSVGKNRFGPSGRSATFNHDASGLTPVFASDETNPMMTVRFDAATGTERRRVTVYGSGGKTVEVDGEGKPLAERKGLLSRLLGR